MQRVDPYRGFRFRVEIDGSVEGGFQSITGIERQSQIEVYREGGINNYEHQLITLNSHPPLVLKRGITDVYLWNWHQEVINGDVVRKTISVVLLGETGEEAWRWICADAFPSKWTLGDLDATTSNIATESIEIVHQGLTKQG